MTGKDALIALWVVFLCSTNLLVQKLAVDYVSIYVLTFLRVALVFPLIFFYKKPEKQIYKYVIAGFFYNALYLLLFGLGIKTKIGAGASAFLLQTQVLFGILFCILILKEKPKSSVFTGICIAFIGVYLLTAYSSDSDIPMFGASTLILACISWGIGFALLKKYKIGSTMSDVTWLSLTSALPLLLACFYFEGAPQTFEMILNISWVAMCCILFATLVSTLWANYLWLGLIQRVEGSSAATFMLMLPVFSTLMSHVVWEEKMTFLQIGSGLIIILGVMVTQEFHKKVLILVQNSLKGV